MKRAVLFASAVACVALGLYSADEYWPSAFAAPVAKADAVVVSKSARTLTLLAGGAPIKSYKIALGRSPTGPKKVQGDGRTPEGRYLIEWRKPNSRFYRALRVSYPNVDERAAAVRQGADPGGDIMIHGVPRGLGLFAAILNRTDWTDGCIAVDDVAMAEIWSAVEVGTSIDIRP